MYDQCPSVRTCRMGMCYVWECITGAFGAFHEGLQCALCGSFGSGVCNGGHCDAHGARPGACAPPPRAPAQAGGAPRATACRGRAYAAAEAACISKPSQTGPCAGLQKRACGGLLAPRWAPRGHARLLTAHAHHARRGGRPSTPAGGRSAAYEARNHHTTGTR